MRQLQGQKPAERIVGGVLGPQLELRARLRVALRERLAGALLELGTKFGAEDARGRLLTLKLTHSDLAELVGASRQRFTVQLSDFERTGVIIRDGRRLIIVTEQLLAVVQGDKAGDGAKAAE